MNEVVNVIDELKYKCYILLTVKAILSVIMAMDKNIKLFIKVRIE